MKVRQITVEVAILTQPSRVSEARLFEHTVHVCMYVCMYNVTNLF
jgi:hypothetical protein